MALTAVGTAFVDYSNRRGGWGMGPYSSEAVPIWVPRAILDLVNHPKAAVGTTEPGKPGFGHRGILYVQTDGPGTSGGTQSIMILRSSSSSSCSSSSSSSRSSSSSSSYSVSSSSSSLSSSSSSSLAA